jgi:collagenase-like PrtC family protease
MRSIAASRDETNARNFPGLNFSREELREAINFAHARRTQVFVAINTFMRAGDEQLWYKAVDDASALGADAVILADFGLMAYTAERHPQQRLHVSVQASASNADAISFLIDAFKAKRVVLPRVLTIPRYRKARTQDCLRNGSLRLWRLVRHGRRTLLALVLRHRPLTEYERCLLACKPCAISERRFRARFGTRGLHHQPFSRLAKPQAIRPFAKGVSISAMKKAMPLKTPVSLDVMNHIDELRAAGVSALKIEGRQRGKAYVAEVVSTLRQTLAAGPRKTGRSAFTTACFE